MKVQFDHVNITVDDIKESLDWYQRILSFGLLEGGVKPDGTKWAITGKDDNMICMTEHSDRKPPLSYPRSEGYHQLYHFGFRVSDREKWEFIIKKHNLELYYGSPWDYPNSTSWYVCDPTGHSIEVSYSGGEPMKFPQVKA